MKAFRLKLVDEEYKIYLQAWVNREAKAEKKKGKGSEFVYKKFESFFDYEMRVKRALGENNDEQPPSHDVSDKLRKYYRKEGNHGNL